MCGRNKLLRQEFARKFPTKLPGLRLGRLAASLEHQNKGIGGHRNMN